MGFIHRITEELLVRTIETMPLVYLNGIRQCGKSTLVRNLSVSKEINYISFDSPTILTFARNDPAGFIKQLPQNKLNIIDEVQLAPELYRCLKMAVDEKRFASKDRALYVLTGSANILTLPTLADALAGRMAILTLYPFSTAEIKGTGKNFIRELWNNELSPANYSRAKLVDIITNSTFPELAIDRKKDRNVWFDGYITTILHRDVRVLADIKNPSNIFQLLVSFSQRAGGLLNNTGVMKETGFDAKTYEKYKALCIGTFLIFELPSWTKPNKLNKQFVKQKKLYFTDTALLCYLMQRDMEEIYRNDMTCMGHIFENFIAVEIMKAVKSAGTYHVSHFNPVQGHGKEVDFVIENQTGEAVAIEVKLSATLIEKDWANMGLLREILGKKFLKGIIIYTGTELLPVSRDIWAVPVNYLWE